MIASRPSAGFLVAVNNMSNNSSAINNKHMGGLFMFMNSHLSGKVYLSPGQVLATASCDPTTSSHLEPYLPDLKNASL